MHDPGSSPDALRVAEPLNVSKTIAVRAMNDSDLAGVRRLRQVVGWLAEPAAFELLREMREARWAVAESRGVIVGMVGAIPLGRVGILCHLAVRKDFRRLGVGADLSRWAVSYLRSRGAKVVRLYSTEQAGELYRSLGFETVHQRILYRRGSEPRMEFGGERSLSVRGLCRGDLPEVIGYDRWWCGFDRSQVVLATLKVHPGLGFVVRDGAGMMRGYAIVSPFLGRSRIGPLMACDPETSRSLLSRLLAAGDEGTAFEATFAGAEDHAARAVYEEFGFVGVPDRVMMQLGPNVAEENSSHATTAYLAT